MEREECSSKSEICFPSAPSKAQIQPQFAKKPPMVWPISKIWDIIPSYPLPTKIHYSWCALLKQEPSTQLQISGNHHRLLLLQLCTPNACGWKKKNRTIYKPPSVESHLININDSSSYILYMKFHWEIWVISPLMSDRVESFTTKTIVVARGTSPNIEKINWSPI